MYRISLEEVRALLISHSLLREIAAPRRDAASPNESGPDLRVTCVFTRVFTNVSCDSRDAGKDTLFFVKGLNFREEYLAEAFEKGLEAYVAERLFETQTAGIAVIVTDVKKAMAVVGARFYGNPQEKLRLIAFTGTKGKTTAVYFTKHILDYSTNKKTAMVSTIDTTLDGVRYSKSQLTTPESLDLFGMMAGAVENGMKYMIVEVSSQAYKTDRVYGLRFDLGVFLNISPDHIGPVEHSSFEDYFFCKCQLLRNSAVVVLNRNSDRFDRLLEAAAGKIVYIYGTDKKGVHVYAEPSPDDPPGFTVRPGELAGLEDICGGYKLRLAGGFNAENALAAAVAARLAGAAPEDIARGIAETSVPGRMEILNGKNGSAVYVDYAHNKASLEALLGVVKESCRGRVIVVIGAPGGKGQSRRRDLGLVLDAIADAAVLTSDDPGFEDPAAIAEEIRAVMPNPEKARIIAGREDAIRFALSLAETPDDAVVIAGKGADRFQIVNGVKNPYDGDYTIAERIIEAMIKGMTNGKSPHE
ncbi:MAG: UDP-N-acetylmuramyl-tripeptide synthetase [Treponema sp.]|jgi:UDP-N-acetylmuramoyl-L-alanyl-D-glutamate-L-lysine ligase|nr:UDP-N-acetylmuramyl-tripeptide synthetase [Treponema sp.]